MKKIKLWLVLFFLNHDTVFCDDSAVYNLRIAETTKRQRGTVPGAYSASSLTGFNTYRHRYSGQRENYGGIMGTFIHVHDPFYIRVDWAGADVRADNEATDLHLHKIETDDLLILAGYSFEHPSKKVKGTLSGIFGFPTHKDKGLFEPQFGIAEFGLGTQLSWAYHFSDRHPNYSVRTAARFVHFFPRTNAEDGEKFQYSKGHLFDWIGLFRISTIIGTLEKHRIKMGYNPTFFFGISLSPNLDDTVENEQYIRHSFFMDYKFRFYIKKHLCSVAAAISYGFDTKKVQNKRIIVVWGVAGINY